MNTFGCSSTIGAGSAACLAPVAACVAGAVQSPANSGTRQARNGERKIGWLWIIAGCSCTHALSHFLSKTGKEGIVTFA
jgi:hypothetical protein